MDPLIWAGFKQELTHEDLYSIPEEVKSQHLMKHFGKLVTVYDIYIIVYMTLSTASFVTTMCSILYV